MKKRVRNLIRLVLLAVFIVSTVLLIRQWRDNTDAEAAYQDAVSIAMQKTAEKLPEKTNRTFLSFT